jgi:hypothetical protein
VNPVKGRLPILLGLVAVSLAAIPATANAQLAGKPHRVGVLHLGPRAAVERYDKILEAGLRESRYAVGEHIVLEYRFADGQRQRLTDLASELVALQVGFFRVFRGWVAPTSGGVPPAQTPGCLSLIRFSPVDHNPVATLGSPPPERLGPPPADVSATRLCGPPNTPTLHSAISGGHPRKTRKNHKLMPS